MRLYPKEKLRDVFEETKDKDISNLHEFIKNSPPVSQ